MANRSDPGAPRAAPDEMKYRDPNGIGMIVHTAARHTSRSQSTAVTGSLGSRCHHPRMAA